MDTTNFKHRIGDLQDRIKFKSVDLRSSGHGFNVKVFIAMSPRPRVSILTYRVQSLDADNAVIKARNGPITGKFHASESLHLVTTDMPMKVDVVLENQDADYPSHLYLTSTHGFVGLSFLRISLFTRLSCRFDPCGLG